MATTAKAGGKPWETQNVRKVAGSQPMSLLKVRHYRSSLTTAALPVTVAVRCRCIRATNVALLAPPLCRRSAVLLLHVAPPTFLLSSSPFYIYEEAKDIDAFYTLRFRFSGRGHFTSALPLGFPSLGRTRRRY